MAASEDGTDDQKAMADPDMISPLMVKLADAVCGLYVWQDTNAAEAVAEVLPGDHVVRQLEKRNLRWLIEHHRQTGIECRLVFPAAAAQEEVLSRFRNLKD